MRLRTLADFAARADWPPAVRPGRYGRARFDPLGRLGPLNRNGLPTRCQACPAAGECVTDAAGRPCWQGAATALPGAAAAGDRAHLGKRSTT